MSTFLNSRNIL